MRNVATIDRNLESILNYGRNANKPSPVASAITTKIMTAYLRLLSNPGARLNLVMFVRTAEYKFSKLARSLMCRLVSES